MKDTIFASLCEIDRVWSRRVSTLSHLLLSASILSSRQYTSKHIYHCAPILLLIFVSPVKRVQLSHLPSFLFSRCLPEQPKKLEERHKNN